MTSARLQTVFAMLAIAAVALFSHLALVPIGFAFMDSDDATVAIVTNLFRHGEWSPFYLNQPYGGTVLTFIRALFVAIWERLSHAPEAHVASQMAFTYGVIPVAWALTVHSLAKTYCSPRSAFIAGLLAAVGYHFWLEQFERDFYMAYLFLGSLLLILRAPFRNPLLEARVPRLLFMAFLSGFALYTCRAALVYVVAVWLPWRLVREEAALFLKPAPGASLPSRVLRWVSAFFLALFTWIELFGRNFGQLAGHTIKLDAAPNLKFAVLLLVLLPLSRRSFRLPRETLKRGLLAGAAFLAGLAPEILFRLTHHAVEERSVTSLLSARDALITLSELPGAFTTLLVSDTSLIAFASLLLGTLALGALFRKALHDPERRLEPVVFSAALSFLAFVALVGSPAPPRYLLPLAPLLMVGVASLLDQLNEPTRYAMRMKWLVYPVVLLHLVHQAQARYELITSPEPGITIEKARWVVDAFQRAQVKVVIANDYWETNQYGFLSRCRPCFTSTGRKLGDPRSFELAADETRAGILLKEVPGADSGPTTAGSVELLGSKWSLTPLESWGERRLYVGKRVPQSAR